MTNPADFFRARIDAMIDMRNPLAVLATRMPWQQIESAIAPHLKRPVRTGRHTLVVDLFGTTAEIAGAGCSAAGRPRLRASGRSAQDLSGPKRRSMRLATR